VLLATDFFYVLIQGVAEVGALILTGGGARQREQLFSLPFWRKTLRSGLGKIFLKPFISPKLSYIPKNVKQPDSYEVDFLLYG
jgi:hypothetical protein